MQNAEKEVDFISTSRNGSNFIFPFRVDLCIPWQNSEKKSPQNTQNRKKRKWSINFKLNRI